MKKYKVCVYAICKNESKNIKRWYDSMKEADEIYVLDTGSTDDSVKVLKNLKVNVKTKKYKEWRFDKARNDSLKMVPDDCDICVCTDIDEVFNEGWRDELENIWNKNIKRVKYCLNFSFDEYNNPATTLFISKIHERHNVKWVHIIHEVIECYSDLEEITSDKIVLNHYPDNEKSRKNYLPLLEKSVELEPDSDRNLHYLGREYMYNNKYEEAIKVFHQHLLHPNSTWAEERNASMRFMARCYNNLNYLDEAIMWYEKSIRELSNMRESYVELAYIYYQHEAYEEAYKLLSKAYEITDKSINYINEDFCWNSFIDDVMSVTSYKMGRKEEAIHYLEKALEKNPNDLRLIANYKLINGELF